MTKSFALPARFYGDPIEVVDEMIRLSEEEKRRVDLHRLHKGRRIRALVREVLRKGGKNESKIR